MVRSRIGRQELEMDLGLNATETLFSVYSHGRNHERKGTDCCKERLIRERVVIHTSRCWRVNVGKGVSKFVEDSTVPSKYCAAADRQDGEGMVTTA